MHQRRIIAAMLAFVLTIGLTAFWSAEGDENEGDTAANIVAANEAPTGQSDADMPQKKKGNRFARFFKAPFKAVGKLFKGDNDGRPERLTEKDVKRFESVGVLKVEERREREHAREAGTSVTARDYLDEGRVMLQEGRLNDAIAALSRATSLDPQMREAHNLLAVAYDRKGLHERARESFNRAIDLGETDAQALNNLGWSLYLSGNYRAAVERLKRAARLAPTDERILNNLALAQCRLGKYDDAFKSFARAGGEFNARLNVAALLERSGREHEAIKHYEHARRLQPNSMDVQRRLASLYSRVSRDVYTDTVNDAIHTNKNGGQPTLAVAGGK
ncbi:MAG TPA: tetratricopeptide repeat protein [Pyrinomonadaceae bacterium]|jgi:Flp pilus assembly protein TadD|nr:tetratricopeptide repeat protein [Pyrinomonadaceae bacterium]